MRKMKLREFELFKSSLKASNHTTPNPGFSSCPYCPVRISFLIFADKLFVPNKILNPKVFMPLLSYVLTKVLFGKKFDCLADFLRNNISLPIARHLKLAARSLLSMRQSIYHRLYNNPSISSWHLTKSYFLKHWNSLKFPMIQVYLQRFLREPFNIIIVVLKREILFWRYKIPLVSALFLPAHPTLT